MDEIQKILIQAGRKDLAQEYYNKISSEGEEGMALNYAMKELIESIKNVKNPKGWAEKHSNPRNVKIIIEMIEKLTVIFDKMK